MVLISSSTKTLLKYLPLVSSLLRMVREGFLALRSVTESEEESKKSLFSI